MYRQDMCSCVVVRLNESLLFFCLLVVLYCMSPPTHPPTSSTSMGKGEHSSGARFGLPKVSEGADSGRGKGGKKGGVMRRE